MSSDDDEVGINDEPKVLESDDEQTNGEMQTKIMLKLQDSSERE